MKSFEIFEKHLAACGIEISKESPNSTFNVKNSTIFILGCVITGLIAASLTEANTFDERIDILFQSISFAVCLIDYIIIVWKTSKLVKFINSLTDAINESEY